MVVEQRMRCSPQFGGALPAPPRAAHSVDTPPYHSPPAVLESHVHAAVEHERRTADAHQHARPADLLPRAQGDQRFFKRFL